MIRNISSQTEIVHFRSKYVHFRKNYCINRKNASILIMKKLEMIML